MVTMPNGAVCKSVLGAARIAYPMLRVRNLEKSIAFYTGQLDMTVFRRRDYPYGKFTLVFLGYGNEAFNTVIELTHNWGEHSYQHGTAFGHIALAVPDVYAACERLRAAGASIIRPAGPMKADAAEVIAFIEDPDGYRIELVGDHARAVEM
jgi:lactoylglutathione lyase